MHRLAAISPVLLIAVAAGAGLAATFTDPPALTVSGGRATLTFSVSESTDVEVAILSADHNIVRHLAAGVVGGSAVSPEPLASGVSQSLVWDGTDDRGAVAAGAPFTARVRLGTRPQFERTIPTNVFGSGYFYGPGNVASTGAIMSLEHPIWKSGWAGEWVAPNGTTLATAITKLDITVSDVTDEIFAKGYNPYGSNPVLAHWDGKTGLYKGLIQMTVFNAGARPKYGQPYLSWDGRYLWHDGGDYYLHRFTLTGASAPFSSGFNYTSPPLTAAGSDYRQHGLTAGPDGGMLNGHYSKNASGAGLPFAVSAFDSDGRLVRDEFITVHGNIGQGVRVDPRGNVFVGARIKPQGQYVPARIADSLAAAGGDFATKGSLPWWAEEVYGSILKFGPAGGSVLPDAAGDLMGGQYRERLKPTGLAWMHYGASFQPTHTVSRSNCVCHNPRFDVDRFGRVAFPNAFENEFKILDNNGNVICEVYNRDLLPDVAIGYNCAIEVTDRALYLADWYNNRVVSFTWRAAVEAVVDIPGFTGAGEGPRVAFSRSLLNNHPNPANPGTRIEYAVHEGAPSVVEIAIYGVDGRLVRLLARGLHAPGGHSVYWDGRDAALRPVADGLYHCILSTARSIGKRKIALVR